MYTVHSNLKINLNTSKPSLSIFGEVIRSVVD